MAERSKIRRLEPEDTDWQAVLELILSSFAYMTGIIDPPSSAHRLTVGALREKAGREQGYAIFHGAVPVACMFCDPRPGCLYVGKLAIARDWQGRGLGRKLMAHAEQVARSLGQDTLELQTRVELTGNHLFFQGLGYHKTGETAHAGYSRATSITLRKQLK
ncbi:MAG: GNAT family N-acetyltransferase [Nitratireductor sp.]|nr:GNAT family N-acetyltransferase [Nitratireductor sp.]